MKQFLKRYELVFFFLLTYLLSWWSVPLMNGALIPQGPMFAAMIVIALTAGRPGLREYWKQLTHWRAGWWYLVGPLIIVGYTGIAFVFNVLSGATLVKPLHLLALGVFVQLLFFGGQWEEPGWTGYALPKLQERFANRPNGALRAVLMLGVFRAIWHLPLFVYGKLYWFDIFVFSFAIQIIIAWLYHRSGKSVPAVMLFHFVSNILGAIMFPVFAGAERLMFQALFMSLAVLIAMVLVWSSQIKFGQKRVEVI
jgi:CAAX protease family protein